MFDEISIRNIVVERFERLESGNIVRNIDGASKLDEISIVKSSQSANSKVKMAESFGELDLFKSMSSVVRLPNRRKTIKSRLKVKQIGIEIEEDKSKKKEADKVEISSTKITRYFSMKESSQSLKGKRKLEAESIEVNKKKRVGNTTKDFGELSS